jgi:peptide/nickel transport system permease protein
MDNTSEKIAQAITLIHQGQKEQARQILLALVKANPRDEAAWLWLVETVDNDTERIRLLEQCLKRIPQSHRAQTGLAHLRTKQGRAAAGPSQQTDRLHPPVAAPPEVLRPADLPLAVLPPARSAQEQAAAPIPPEASAPEPSLPAERPRSPLDIPTKPTPKRQPISIPEKPEKIRTAHAFSQTFTRFIRYSSIRLVTLCIMVVISVFLTIIVANLGGFLDKVVSANIDESIGMMIHGGWLKEVTDEAERNQIIDQFRAAMHESAGLNSPFLLRCVKFLWTGLTLDWGVGRPYSMYTVESTPEVRETILDFLPRTLLVFGTANILLFFTSIFIALGLSRKYGSWQDRLITALAPLAAAPSWVYGLIIAGVTLHVLRTYTMPFNRWPPGFQLSYLKFYLGNMLPAVAAIFISKFFQSVYAWRTVFLVNSSEDYVDVAKAKGMPDRMIERRYILRPLLPNIITNFVLIMIALWQESIILETIFSVAGIGALFRAAIQSFDIRMIVALVVTFAYILAITVFLLDIIYALVDPRVSMGIGTQTLKIARKGKGFFSWFLGGRLLREPKRVKSFSLSRRSALTYPKPVFSSQAKQPIVIRRHPDRRAGYKPSKLTAFILGWRFRLKNAFRTLVRYPAAIVGLTIILVLCVISIYTVIAYPYTQTNKTWRGDNFSWRENPTYAQPVWVNWFRKDDLPESIKLDSRDPAAGKTDTPVSQDMREISFSFAFDYHYKYFPQDIILFLDATYAEKRPLVNLVWSTPDGREMDLGNFSVASAQANYLFLDENVQRKLKTSFVDQGLFGDPNSQEPVALQGHYTMKVTAFVFEDGADINTRFVLYGKVWGLAGTDGKRRDAMIGLLWGTPIALSFGLLAALFTTITTLVIAAVGVWFGGWVDGLIQRLTEINMILPLFPALLLVYTLYSKRIWVLLGVTVLLSIFGSGIKNYRSLFIQIKELPYFEVARAYGASDWRIIFRYLIPRIGAIIIPQLVILVPSYVFLEAGLAVLGLYDPFTPPTWGQLVMDGLQNGIAQGGIHLALEPAFLLLLTGYAFLLLGISLERVFEPRLRER